MKLFCSNEFGIKYKRYMGYIVYMVIVFNKYLYFLRMFMLYFKIRDVVGDGI